jgi:hypothetical protein
MRKRKPAKIKCASRHLEIQYKHLSWLTSFVIEGVGKTDFYNYEEV